MGGVNMQNCTPNKSHIQYTIQFIYVIIYKITTFIWV